ncbi:LPS translocon maturation chaperone LptM [Salinimonas sediminis]|uniref:LPS translocon maturation chaperone LptM n=1 Tax=Salinimonas sediminis TaxID=2303538 RepID=UPI001474D5F8|nr:lipoprotein [Salinimonas sediminis]
MLKKPCLLLIFVLSSALLSACGYRGDLYLPDEAQSNQTEAQDSTPANAAKGRD